MEGRRPPSSNDHRKIEFIKVQGYVGNIHKGCIEGICTPSKFYTYWWVDVELFRYLQDPLPHFCYKFWVGAPLRQLRSPQAPYHAQQKAFYVAFRCAGVGYDSGRDCELPLSRDLNAQLLGAWGGAINQWESTSLVDRCSLGRNFVGFLLYDIKTYRLQAKAIGWHSVRASFSSIEVVSISVLVSVIIFENWNTKSFFIFQRQNRLQEVRSRFCAIFQQEMWRFVALKEDLVKNPYVKIGISCARVLRHRALASCIRLHRIFLHNGSHIASSHVLGHCSLRQWSHCTYVSLWRYEAISWECFRNRFLITPSSPLFSTMVLHLRPRLSRPSPFQPKDKVLPRPLHYFGEAQVLDEI